jgi:hypothetical protein
MKPSQLNEWLQILASFGVLVGLLVVAYEIKQNTEFARVNHYQSTYNMWMDFSSLEIESDIGDIFIRSIEDPESLSPRDVYRLNAYYVTYLSIHENTGIAMDFGLATAGPSDAIGELEAQYYFSSEFSRRWFERNKYWLRPYNVEVISRAIESTPVATSWERVEALLLRPTLE